MEELEGILRLLLGASVQVSGRGKGNAQLRLQWWETPASASPTGSPAV